MIFDNNITLDFDDLNSAQREAVESTEGPVLVLAGAGTGKTKVLISRIANLIATKNIPPYKILAVTFTNKASKEMRERLGHMINADGIWLGTFHAMAAQILRRHSELIDIKNNFTIVDTDDQKRLIKTLLNEHHYDEKAYPPKLILSIIQRWKDKGLAPEKITGSDVITVACEVALRIYRKYQLKLTALNAVDFGDLLLHNLTIFSKFPNILIEYQKRFEYILVDEYQDTNISQYLWLRLLATKHQNICCVGDEDQSIYGWRGAEIGNIMRFEQDFSGAKLIRLERNYRSTNHILRAASCLIANNKQRFGKNLWTEEIGGEKVKLLYLYDDRDEARYISNEISELVKTKDQDISTIAILVRASFQTRAFEECFISRAIPYQVIGGMRFYERQEIRDIVAYIRITVQEDDDLALERIINTPKRSIGAASISKIHQYAKENNLSLYTAIIRKIEENDLPSRIRIPLINLISLFKKWRKEFEEKPARIVVENILKESGYLAMLQQEKTIEAEGRIENIKELIRALDDFNNITEFLEYISLVSEKYQTTNEKMVTVMTIHAAKGLEFNTVFLPGLEEGIFPHQRSIDENGIKGVEEERRLAYVGITRARKNLYISFTLCRRVYNQYQTNAISRFVKELPEDDVELFRLC